MSAEVRPDSARAVVPPGAYDCYLSTNGIRLYAVVQGEGPLVLLCHGFPEIWYSWRNVLGPIAAAGYRAVAVDLPGYGRSDKPDRRYDTEWVNECLAGAIEALGHERAVLVGHDFGGLLVWPFARRHPHRTAGVVGVNTPDLPRPPVPITEVLRAAFPDQPPYIVQFQAPGAAEWVFSWGRGARDFIELMFRNEFTKVPEAFSDDVIDVFVEAFAPSGALTPPIGYYRAIDRSWEQSADLDAVAITVPCLMINAADDPVLPPALSEGMEVRVPDLRRVLIADCGHWTQQERPAETAAAIVEYLGALDPWT